MSKPTNRRDFVAAVALAVPIICCAGHTAHAADEPAPATAKGWIPTVKADTLKSGQFNSDFADKHKFLLSRSGDQVVAIDTKCTHKGCAVKVKETLIECPCHHAQYDVTGKVTRPPAKEDLGRYALRVNGDGVIEVDTTTKIKATDPGAVLAVAGAAKSAA